MKRKAAAMLLCVMLLVQLAVPSAGAAEDMYFVAAGEYVLALSDDTMPFWHNGYLYVSSTIFTGTVRDALNISRGYDKKADAVVLYSSEKYALAFEVGKNHAQSTEGKFYYPGAIRRNGNVFVPAALVSSFFGLKYSYTEVDRGHLVWLRRPETLQLQESVFINAASLAMEERYNEYQKSKGGSVPEGGSAAADANITGKAVYLCMQGGVETEAVLDVLDRYEEQAAFFCDQAFLETQGALLRRMTATGHAVGLLVDGAHESLSVLDQAQRANAVLARATCGGTRLVRVENGTDAQWEALQAAGYCCMEEDLDRSGYALRTTAHAESLQKRIAAHRGNAVVWLGDRVGAAGLQAFLRIAADEEGRCLALTEIV